MTGESPLRLIVSKGGNDGSLWTLECGHRLRVLWFTGKRKEETHSRCAACHYGYVERVKDGVQPKESTP